MGISYRYVHIFSRYIYHGILNDDLDMIYDDELEDAKGRLDMNRGSTTMHEDTRLGMFAKLFRFARCVLNK